MMHDYQNRGLAGGAVRKSNKTKGESCEEARIAVRKRLKTKEADFEGGWFFGGKGSLRRAQPVRGWIAIGGFAIAGRQKRATERAGERMSCESITRNEFPC